MRERRWNLSFPTCHNCLMGDLTQQRWQYQIDAGSVQCLRQRSEWAAWRQNSNLTQIPVCKLEVARLAAIPTLEEGESKGTSAPDWDKSWGTAIVVKGSWDTQTLLSNHPDMPDVQSPSEEDLYPVSTSSEAARRWGHPAMTSRKWIRCLSVSSQEEKDETSPLFKRNQLSMETWLVS